MRPRRTARRTASVRFLAPAGPTGGQLQCTATVLHLGERSALAQARLVDADGTLLAHASSGALIRPM